MRLEERSEEERLGPLLQEVVLVPQQQVCGLQLPAYAV